MQRWLAGQVVAWLREVVLVLGERCPTLGRTRGQGCASPMPVLYKGWGTQVQGQSCHKGVM